MPSLIQNIKLKNISLTGTLNDNIESDKSHHSAELKYLNKIKIVFAE